MGFLSIPAGVSVPATSANLGPGFDCLGLALDWRDELRASVTAGGLSVRVEGTNADGVPRDESHLVVTAMRRGFLAMGIDPPGLKLTCVNAIPHTRGLGSSAAAIVGGLCLARELEADPTRRLSDHQVFQIAAEMEGHPDNVAAALFGGFVISGKHTDDEASRSGEKFFAHSSLVHADIVAVAFVPESGVETRLARSLLPANVLHRFASANASRAALLVSALASFPDALFTATQDFLHQSFRESAMPHTLALVEKLRADRLAAVVSGAGPSVLLLGDEEMVAAVLDRGEPGWSVRRVDIDHSGVRQLI